MHQIIASATTTQQFNIVLNVLHYTGPEANRMTEVCGRFQNGESKFPHKDSSAYHVLLDWVQPYNSVQHSTGVLAIQCTDTPSEHLGKVFNRRIIAVTPGKLKCGRSMLLRTLTVMKSLATGDKTLQVTEQYRNGHGDLVRREFNHIPYLTGFKADSPARWVMYTINKQVCNR